MDIILKIELDVLIYLNLTFCDNVAFFSFVKESLLLFFMYIIQMKTTYLNLNGIFMEILYIYIERDFVI